MRPVLVSVDKPAEADRTFRVYELPFPVLSDPDLALHRAFRVLNRVDDALVAKYKGFGIDLQRSSGRSHQTIAVPSVFVIDRRGVVRWAHADHDHRTRPSVEQLLKVLDGLRL